MKTKISDFHSQFAEIITSLDEKTIQYCWTKAQLTDSFA